MDIKGYISSGIIELYVMGLCSDEEKLELEQLRQQYAELDQAIIDYEIDLEKNMLVAVTVPPRDIDEKVLNYFDQQMPPQNTADKTGSKTNTRLFKLLAVAASFALLVSLYFIYRLQNKISRQQVMIEAMGENSSALPLSDYRILTDPAITPVAMYGFGTHAICRCTMFWDKKTGKMYIMIHHLPRSSSSKDYQLWAMIDNKPVSVGIIDDAIRGRFIEMKSVPASATSFIVTLEKAGGESTPTVEETYLSGSI